MHWGVHWGVIMLWGIGFALCICSGGKLLWGGKLEL